MGCELINNCSNEPSSKSERKILSSDNIAASKAATQIMPGAMRASNSGMAPIANGNNVMTNIKNKSGLADIKNKGKIHIFV